MKESYNKALTLLRENRDLMDKIAAFLIEKETITGKEFMEIFRREKGLPEPEEKPAQKAEETPKQSVLSQPLAGANQSIFDQPVAEAGQSVLNQPEEGAKDAGEDVSKKDTSAETAKDASQEESKKPPYLNEAPVDDRPVGRFSNRRLDD